MRIGRRHRCRRLIRVAIGTALGWAAFTTVVMLAIVAARAMRW
jgi:hypothetical protein